MTAAEGPGSVLRWLAAALVVLGAGCGGTETVHVSLGKDATADAGAIELSFRAVHRTYEHADGTRGSAAPYVKVGDGWLEIVDRVTIASLDNLYELRRGRCTTEERRDGDFVYRTMTGCDIEVESLGDDADELRPFTTARTLNVGSRYAATATAKLDDDGLVGVRSTGFSVGDVTGSVAGTIVAGLDVVTSFGVKNLDYDGSEKPIVGHERSFELGPQRVFVKILDAANANIRCDGGCRDVLDVEVRTEPLDPRREEADVFVVRYR